MSNISIKSSLLAVAVLMVLSGCGKSKDLKTPESVAAKPVVATPVPTANSISDNPQALPGNSIPNTGQLLPANNGSGFDNDVLPPLPAGPAENPSTDHSSVIRPPLAEASSQKEKAYEIDFTNQQAIKTGGQTKDLFYTASSADGLINEFKTNSLKVSADQQRMNMNLAKAIVTAKLSRSNSSGEVNLELNIDESLNGIGAVKVYRIKAIADVGMMKLSLAFRSMGALQFQGGFLKCLDADGGCENAYAKIKMSGAYTRILFRNSYADMHFLIQENISNNFAFDMMKSYVLNTANNIRTNARIEKLQVSSFEVTNGRAGMGALLTTRDNEMIGLSIPLVVSGNKSEVMASVTKLSDLSKSYDLSVLANSYSQKLSQQISDVKLVNNNGLGQLKLKMSFGQGMNTGSIWMVVAKVQKPEMSINQIREFEAKLKNF